MNRLIFRNAYLMFLLLVAACSDEEVNLPAPIKKIEEEDVRPLHNEPYAPQPPLTDAERAFLEDKV